MNPRILLIEDEAELRNIIAEILVSRGIQVVTAKNGLEALRILQADHAFDLILTDWNMPVMDGERFLSEFEKSPRKEIPVIVLSSSCSAKRYGYTYLAKPFSPEMLLNLIAEKLRGFGAG